MIPTLTHLQAFIIQLIVKDEHSGRFIRSRLSDIGEHRSAAAFYQLMARMEKSGQINGHYVTTVVDGQTIKERLYRATLNGMQELVSTSNFYSDIRRRSGLSSVLAEALSSHSLDEF